MAVKQLGAAPSGSTDAATKAYVDAAAAGVGWDLAKIANVKAMPFDWSLASGYCTPSANTFYAIKLYTAVALSVNTILWSLGTNGATCSGFYTAFYNASGSLISSSTSADIGTTFHTSLVSTTNCLSGGGAVSIPAGMFYLGFKIGTAGTMVQFRSHPESNGAKLNFSLSASSAGATAARASTCSGSWSGGTAPASLGTLSQASDLIAVAIS